MTPNQIMNITRLQLKQASAAKSVKIDCQCGKSITITKMYRCHHCGIYFCRKCGTEHFGEDTTGLVGRLSH